MSLAAPDHMTMSPAAMSPPVGFDQMATSPLAPVPNAVVPVAGYTPQAPAPAPPPAPAPAGYITDGFQLFVGALPQDITEEELRIVFSTYGQVRSVKILTNMERSPAGSAFVFYETQQAGEDAITVLNEQYKIRTTPDATPIRVSWAKSQRGKGEVPMGGMNGKGDKGCKGCDSGKGGWDSWAPTPAPAPVPFPAPAGDAWGKGGWPDAWQGSWPGADPWGGKGESWKGPGDAWNSGKGDAWNSGKGDAWNSGSCGKGDVWSNGWSDGGAWDSWKGGKGCFGKDDWKGGGKDLGKDNGKGFLPKVPGDDPRRLYVGNLPADIDEQSIRYVFGTYGSVDGVKIIHGRVPGRACAIVAYMGEDQAQTAIVALDKKYEIRPGDGALQVRIADKARSRVAGAPY